MRYYGSLEKDNSKLQYLPVANYSREEDWKIIFRRFFIPLLLAAFLLTIIYNNIAINNGALNVNDVIVSTTYTPSLRPTNIPSIAHNEPAATPDTDGSTKSPPNFIVIMLDDLSWSSLYYEDSSIVQFAPNINNLRRNGVTISRYYSHSICNPSRAAFLTGRYASSLGMQDIAIEPVGLFGLTLNATLFPQILQNNSYETHLYGKWHLGHYMSDYLPTARGFDYFTGYLTGEIYPFTKRLVAIPGFHDFLDMDKTCYHEYKDEDASDYSAYIIRDKALKTIRNFAKTKSINNNHNGLYLQLSFQSVHSPFVDIDYENGLDADFIGEDLYNRITSSIVGVKQQQYVMSLSIADTAIGEIIEELKKQQIYDNSYILFTSDHGGCYNQGGKSGPLRGTKGTLFEGGTRVGAVFSGGLLPLSRYNTEFDGFMHSTDWFPTILDLASIDYKCDDCDGMSQKEALINGSESLKELMLYDCYVNIPGLTDIYTNATCAVRDKIYKLMHHFEDFKTDLTYDIDEIIDGDDNLNDATQCSTVDSYGKFNYMMYNIQHDEYEANNIIKSTESIISDTLDKLTNAMKHYASIAVHRDTTIDDSGAASAIFHDRYNFHVGPFIKSDYDSQLKYC